MISLHVEGSLHGLGVRKRWWIGINEIKLLTGRTKVAQDSKAVAADHIAFGEELTVELEVFASPCESAIAEVHRDATRGVACEGVNGGGACIAKKIEYSPGFRASANQLA